MVLVRTNQVIHSPTVASGRQPVLCGYHGCFSVEQSPRDEAAGIIEDCGCQKGFRRRLSTAALQLGSRWPIWRPVLVVDEPMAKTPQTVAKRVRERTIQLKRL